MEDKSNSESGCPKFLPEQKLGDDTVPQEQRQDNEQLPAVSRRTPFTNLSQVDADLALARRLQEQERAFMMLSMEDRAFGTGRRFFSAGYDEEEYDFDDPSVEGTGNNTNINNPGSDSHEHNENNDDDDQYEDEDEGHEFAFDENVECLDDEDYEDEDENYESSEPVYDPALYLSDEAYARALQDHEEREVAARLFSIVGFQDHDGHDSTQSPVDGLGEDDPDEFSYEELIALGEVVGTESRGLSADTIASLPSITFDPSSSQTSCSDSCVICRLDFEEGETLTLLSCKHSYHLECINNWLNINKVCPVCSAEVAHP